MIRLVFGCGYLGLRVAKIWQKNGDQVFVVTRSENRSLELSKLGLTPIVADITLPASLNSLPSADTTLFGVGMDRKVYSDIRLVYVEGLKNVLQSLPESTGQIIYISSTGVYGDFGGAWVDETSATIPARDGGKACLEAESLLSSSEFSSRTSILRFAGIYGPERVPTKSLIQTEQWKKLSANGYLNLIHVDDGAEIVFRFSQSGLAEKTQGETFLISDGSPPLRKDYYEFIAEYFGMKNVPWEESEVLPENDRSSSSKRICNRKLIEVTDYGFAHPNYKSGLEQALASAD